MPDEFDLTDGRSSNNGTFESLEYPIEKQVGVLVEFDFVCRIFYSCDVEFVLADPIIYVNFRFPPEVYLIDYKSLGLGTIESSLVYSALTMLFLEDSKVVNVSTKVTCIGSFLLNIILILLFLGDRILS